jgi:hypothetical protein
MEDRLNQLELKVDMMHEALVELLEQHAMERLMQEAKRVKGSTNE